MRAGDSVAWYLQPTRYGGWYIAGYRNRSVTADDYWSPGLHRQGYTRYRREESSIITPSDIQQYYEQRFDYNNLSGT